MGLKEKQHIARIQEENVPGYNQQLQERLGTDAHFDVDWTTFEEDIEALYGLDGFMNVVWNGIEAVTRDSVGKQAVAEAVKRVVIVNVQDVGEKAISVEDGAFRLQAALGNDNWDGRISSNEVQEYLENNL